jgi:hypothetical protein
VGRVVGRRVHQHHDGGVTLREAPDGVLEAVHQDHVLRAGGERV